MRRLFWAIGLAVAVLAFLYAAGFVDTWRRGNQLEDARSRWEASGLADYDWTIEFITAFTSDRYRIQVRDSEVVSFRSPDAGNGARQPTWFAGTVGSLFEYVETAVPSIEYEVRYDAASGLPTEGSFGDGEDVFDDQRMFRVIAFEPVASTDGGTS